MHCQCTIEFFAHIYVSSTSLLLLAHLLMVLLLTYLCAIAGVPSPYYVFWRPFYYWCFHLCWRSAVFTSLEFLVLLKMLLSVMFLLSLRLLSTLLCRFLVGVGVPGVPRILAVAEVPLIGNIPSWTGVSSFSDVTAFVDVPTVVGVPAFAIITVDANVPAVAVIPALHILPTDYRSDTIGYRITVSIFRTTWLTELQKSIGRPPLCISLYSTIFLTKNFTR